MIKSQHKLNTENNPTGLPISGLVAYYKLNNNVNDEGGLYNGTPTNITYGYDQVGGASKAAKFNGTTSFINLDSAKNTFTNANMTISLWAKKGSTNGATQAIFVKNHYTSFTTDWVAIAFDSAGKIAVSVVPTVYANFIYFYAHPTAIEGWVHIALTSNFTANVPKLYINGAFITDVPAVAYGAIDTASNMFIGKAGSGLFLSNNSLVDEVRIYSRALAYDEILALYEQHYSQF